MRAEIFATITGMALVTYATRAGGLWLMGRVRPTPRVEAWLRHLPGAILAALIAPAALASGPAEALATAVTVLVAARTGSVLGAMVAGVATAWGLRLVLA
jgi:uncharacterized membrane protein